MELVRIREKLLDVSRMQFGMTMRVLEILATQLTSELDVYLLEIQRQLVRLGSMEYDLQEADRMQSRQAWLRQRYFEERTSLNQAFERWEEDGQSIVL